MTDEDLIVDLNRLFWLLEEDRQYLARANTARLAARRIEAQAAEIERLRGDLARAEAMLEREIMRVKKIQSDLPPPHKVSLFSVQSEYELMLAELKGDKP